MQDFKNRKFKLWFYHITHAEAIIRSVKNKDFSENIDIYFGNIQYIEMPTVMSELRIESANEKDIMYLTKRVGKEVMHNNVTVMISGEHRYYVIASINKIIKNSLDMMELPIDSFMRPT